MTKAPDTLLPRISVVIPAYNKEQQIRAAIDSALRQSYPPLEVIVVDDGSTDKTASIAEQAGAKVISQQNAGISAARNHGAAEALGEWIAFLDADDLWLSNKLEVQCREAARFPEAAFIGSDFSREQGSAVRSTSWISTRKVYQDVVGARVHEPAVSLTPDELAVCLSSENFIPTSSVMVKRDLLHRVGGFDEAMSLCEDHECWMRLLRAHCAVIVQSPLVRFQMHSGSTLSHWENILEGDVKLTRQMVTAKQEYHPKAVAVAKKLLPKHLTELGAHYVRVGRPEAAVAPLWESLRRAPTFKTCGWLLFSKSLMVSPMRKLFRGAKALRHPEPV